MIELILILIFYCITIHMFFDKYPYATSYVIILTPMIGVYQHGISDYFQIFACIYLGVITGYYTGKQNLQNEMRYL